MNRPEDAPRSSVPPSIWQKPTEAENDAIRKRQRSRSIVMALLLGAFVVLMFGISIAKIKGGMAH
ncbi:hypothetical protein GCM10009087_17140 [Sphingomonas oligophenolica]|uniref:CoxF protein n=1 Tax=Sphingomonas oligophenolica TaxID=301154 RepID=A0ABU9Y5L5_9SPHN